MLRLYVDQPPPPTHPPVQAAVNAVVSCSKSPLTCCSEEFEHASHVLLMVPRFKTRAEDYVDDWTLCCLWYARDEPVLDPEESERRG